MKINRTSLLLFICCLSFQAIPAFSQVTLQSPLSLFTGKDYRYAQSPVRSQAYRGTCTAFAICAALENFPGVAGDLSEQYLYSNVKIDGWVKGRALYGGENLYNYIQVLQKDGVIHEENLPYNPDSVIWRENDDYMVKLIRENGGTGPVSMLAKYGWFVKYRIKEANYIYMYRPMADDNQGRIRSLLSQRDPRDVDYIKGLLDKGHKAIVVTYTLYLPDWRNSSRPFTQPIDPGKYIGILRGEEAYYLWSEREKDPDIGKKIVSEEVTAILVDTTSKNYGGHAVTIVGYNKDGFIIKNSWDTDWCTAGYAVVSYDYHRIFCNEGLVFTAMEYGTPWKDINNNPEKDAWSTLKLKSTPNYNNNRQGLTFSIYSTDLYSDPQFDYLMFRIYEVDKSANTKKMIKNQAVLTSDYFYKNGRILTTLDNYNFFDLSSNKTLMVEVDYKFTGREMVQKKAYYNVSWKNMEYKPGLQSILMREIK